MHLFVLFVANLNSLKDRRDRLSRSFFHIIRKPDSCLHHFPPSRDTSVISRLRSSSSLPRPISRTKKFQSFLNCAVKNYQPPIYISPRFFKIVIIVLLLLLSPSLIALLSYCVFYCNLLFGYSVPSRKCRIKAVKSVSHCLTISVTCCAVSVTSSEC